MRGFRSSWTAVVGMRLLGRLVYISSKLWACPGPSGTHCRISFANQTSCNVHCEGSMSVEKASSLVSSLNSHVGFVACLFVCCVSFSLSYLPFSIDLGKAGSLASWFVPLLTQNQADTGLRCHCARPYLPGLATSTSLSAQNDVISCVPFVTP